jgi:hypothetical protein
VERVCAGFKAMPNRKLCRSLESTVESYFHVCTADVLFLADDAHEPLFGVDGRRFGRQQMTANDEGAYAYLLHM